MGIYINPPNGTKEEFLSLHGIDCTLQAEQARSLATVGLPPSFALVCLVQNPSFTAAAVIWSEREFQAFHDPTDMRRRMWFMVPAAMLKDVSPIMRYDQAAHALGLA